MDMSDATEGASFWQSHISAWQQSGLTQKAYCEQQELRYTTFGYWVRKLRRAAEPATEDKRVFDLVIDFGTSQSPKSTRPLTTYLVSGKRQTISPLASP
ncbi:IS66 family insertion sequence element accessory protein TnpA [Thiolapillus sp.]|uniref:IS66 family insertion sequence element accessory protein TnpA n=1 Tax=Thiolapillus sp. TaxID=2017437 RepID=UPI003AF84331